MPNVQEAKLALREEALAQRRKLRPAELRQVAAGLRDVLLATPEVAGASIVALYVSVGTEPGTGLLLEELDAQGVRVLLPLLASDLDLDWAAYTGRTDLGSGPRGLLQPLSPPLGREAVATADAVLVPGLAVDRTGMRLGRGGASYDRALTRVTASAFTCVLLHDGEALEGPVPHEPHDQRVQAAALPSGLLRFR